MSPRSSPFVSDLKRPVGHTCFTKGAEGRKEMAEVSRDSPVHHWEEPRFGAAGSALDAVVDGPWVGSGKVGSVLGRAPLFHYFPATDGPQDILPVCSNVWCWSEGSSGARLRARQHLSHRPRTTVPLPTPG